MSTETRCRSCGCLDLLLILSLGEVPLANALRTKDEVSSPEAKYPLDLVFCRACSLVQITETVSPEQLFSEYPYFSSFSDTMVAHSADLVDRMVRSKHLDATSLAVEVASNDGYLLQFYRRAGVPVLGVEPAANVARAAEQRGVRTVCEFFGAETAGRLASACGRADVVHANNVLAHVSDLNGVVRGFHTILKDHGIIVVEVPNVCDMIEAVEFDTIYHEHLCYFSLTALTKLFQRHGLAVVDVERLTIHGGSLRVFAGRREHGAEVSPAVAALLAEEHSLGMTTAGFYQHFGAQVERLKRELVDLVRGLRASGKRIAAYGASAKGSTLLGYCGIGRAELDFVADRSTVKQGKYAPGTHLPIRGPEALLEEQPDYVLLLTWNFADEILGQQEEYLRRGGRFIIPVPVPRIV